MNDCEDNTDDESDSVWEDIEEQSEKKTIWCILGDSVENLIELNRVIVVP